MEVMRDAPDRQLAWILEAGRSELRQRHQAADDLSGWQHGPEEGGWPEGRPGVGPQVLKEGH
jgi:hypothetical protein